jgi:hypothetical protein
MESPGTALSDFSYTFFSAARQTLWHLTLF